jgi:hypothetical protein
VATAANTVHKLQKTQYVGANNTMVHNSDVVVKGNLTIAGTQTYAQSEILIVKDNIITLNAAINQSGTPLFNAGIEIDRGSEQNVWILYDESTNAWKFTNDGVNVDEFGGGSAGIYANAAFVKANAAYDAANNALDTWVRNQANASFIKANAAYAFANSTTAWGTRQAFVATAGQTVFSPGSGYLPGYIDVYYNGIKLYGAEDYTATDGINVTLTNPATVNSIIEVVGFGANVPAANVYVLNSMASLLNRQTFFATSGQTTFTPTLSYRVGYVDVYYNGLKMNIPEDVTANNGTTVNFIGLTPTTNDVIEVVGLTPNVALANAIPITGGTISGGINLAGNVNPTTDNTYYLGSSTNRWHSLFVGPGSVDIGGLKLSNVGGVLSVASPGAPATPIAGEDTWVRAQANAAFNTANNVGPQIAPAFNQANAAFNKANTGALYNANTTSNSFFAIPVGTTAERPANAANGAIRYNTTLGRIEGYLYAGGWQGILTDNYSIQYLVIAGGGGAPGGVGGAGVAGGGGAGGYRSSVSSESSGGGTSSESAITVTPGATYTVTVGGGGPGAYSVNQATNGSNSAFGSVVSIGGGFGGQPMADGQRSTGSGGSGGGIGQSGQSPGRGLSAGTGVAGQGYPGGVNGGVPSGGGGGGAGAIGSNGNVGGAGGVGVTSSITGTATERAGGGGGGRHVSDSGPTSSATGGGGGGSRNNGTSGTSNSGGGGGGGGEDGQAWTGGNGGSGVVILRYQGSQRGTGGTITTTGGYTIHTFTGSGTFTA